MIVSSRAALHVSGEQEYPVPGLPDAARSAARAALERARLSDAPGQADPTALDGYESVRLFVARARAVNPAFRVTEDNAAAVAGIVARLQGMPLAIELAAARIKLLPPEAILDPVARPAGQPWAVGRAICPSASRHSAARSPGAMTCSTNRPGACSGDCRSSPPAAASTMAETICGPASELGLDVLDGIEALVDQSLLRAEDVAGEARFRMLETIRAFSAEQLDGQRRSATRSASATPGRSWPWPRTRPRSCRAANSGRWLDRLDVEHDNLRAALEWATARPDPAVAIGLGFRAVALLAEAGLPRRGPAAPRTDRGGALVAATIRRCVPGSWRPSAGSPGGRPTSRR